MCTALCCTFHFFVFLGQADLLAELLFRRNEGSVQRGVCTTRVALHIFLYIPIHINRLKLFMSPLCAYNMPAQDPTRPTLYSRLQSGSTSSVSYTSWKRSR